jgi:putative transposase
VPEVETRFDGLYDRILPLCARGMTVREIQGHLQDLYGVEVSPDLICIRLDQI